MDKFLRNPRLLRHSKCDVGHNRIHKGARHGEDREEDEPQNHLYAVAGSLLQVAAPFRAARLPTRVLARPTLVVLFDFGLAASEDATSRFSFSIRARLSRAVLASRCWASASIKERAARSVISALVSVFVLAGREG